MPGLLLVLALLGAGCRTPEPTMFERLIDENADSLRGARTVPGELLLRCDVHDAEVFIDGVLQGICEDFDGKRGVLGLGDEGHLVEVRKPGFRPWQAQLAPGQARTSLQVLLVPMN